MKTKTNLIYQDKPDFEELKLISQKLKLNMLLTIQNAQTGHIGACCSSTELMTVLYFSDILEIDSKDPKNPNRDIVLVRGHLGPLRYNIFSLLGWMKEEEMLHYREFGSRLPGHEDMNITPGVDITPSGSLGMVLSYAVGARYSFRERGLENRVFCFLGDGEEQEGNISEAARHATNLRLDNLIAIIDKNKKQLSTSTAFTDGGSDLGRIWSGYGWEVLETCGHDIRDIYCSYKKAIELARNGPVCIIANTIKGNGIAGAEENYNGYHVYHNSSEDDTTNRVPVEAEIERLTKELNGKTINIPNKIIKREQIIVDGKLKETNFIISPKKNDFLETSYVYLSEFLEKLSEYAKDKNIYVLTADYPPRKLLYDKGNFCIPDLKYCNVGIREQHLLGMVHGIKNVEKNSEVLVLCGDAFVYRFADQLNVLAQSNDKAIIYSVQAGLSGAKNGFTHQSSGQPGAVLTMPGISFYEPSSKLDWFYVMNKSFNEPGLKFIRTHKLETPFDFGGFNNGDCYSINFKEEADCTIISNGMTLEAAINASEDLYESDKIKARVVNVLNVTNPDGISSLVEKGKPLFVVYNGPPQILGYPIYQGLIKSKNLPSKTLERGFEIGATGSVKDIMSYFGLDSNGIYKWVKNNL